jgi:membrane fusion protein (multidrug efflux system)
MLRCSEMGLSKLVRVLVFSAALAGLALHFAAAQTAGPAAPAAPVGVITATDQPVYNESSYVGRVQSPQVVALNARVTGYLEAQEFTDGDTVKKGQLLYLIEQAPYQAAVAQAQAAVEQAQAQARNAGLTLGRARSLLQSPAGQQSNVDAATATAKSDSAQVDSATAALQTAQINLGYTEIRSPLDGQISATAVNPGNVVGPSTGTLATIVSQDPMYVVFALPVADALKLRNGAAGLGATGLNGLDLLVQLPDGRMYGQTGVINFINNQVTATTDTLTWRGTIANPLLPANKALPDAARELTEGEFVTVILRARMSQQKIVIPQDAVITDQLGDYVLEVNDQGVVVRQPVTQGAATSDSVQIESGIKPGDKIIVDGIQRVHPGVKVTIKPEKSA